MEHAGSQLPQTKKPIIQEKLIQLGYILGVALILSGLIYFFAANWQGFSRTEKVALSVGVMLLFYGLSYVFSRIFQRHSFLSRILLFAGCFAFGISVALIGQIYNSHANSYVLFTVWLVATLLFSFVTRYQPLYVLSLGLFHLSVWFYFFPEGGLYHFDDQYLVTVFLLLIASNALVFILTEMKILESLYLRFLSYIAAHVFLISVSMKFFIETYAVFTNLLYIAILAICFYYFLKVQQHNGMITLTGIATTAYLIIKYIEVLVDHFGPMIFLITLVLGALAVAANVYLVKKLRQKYVTNNDRNETEESSSNTKKYVTWQNLATIFFTILSSIVITVSLTLLISDTIGEFENLAVTFFFMGIGLFLVPGIFINKKNEVIGGTLISIGYLMSSISIMPISDVYFVLWLAIVTFGFLRISNDVIRMLLYLMFHVVAAFKLFDFIREFDVVCLILIVINVAMLLVSKYQARVLADEKIARSIYRNSFFYGLFIFFILTFLEGNGYKYWLYFGYNVLFFVIVTYLLFWSHHREHKFDYKISLGFWFAFLFYKYYDLVWQLLHKSIALIILGILFVIATYWIERIHFTRTNGEGLSKPSIENERAKERNELGSIWNGKTIYIVILIVAQILFLGAQIATSEQALSNGTLVKLQLEPIDPRSIMQGDYVILNYTISRPGHEPFAMEPIPVVPEEIVETREKERPDPQEWTEEEWEKQKEEWDRQQQEYWDNRWDRDLRHGQKIQLLLSPDENGIHQFKEIYTGQAMNEQEVVINGTYRGWRVLFGIESYFVPEGTGLEIERAANYAYVRIARNGNAIIERLSED